MTLNKLLHGCRFIKNVIGQNFQHANLANNCQQMRKLPKIMRARKR